MPSAVSEIPSGFHRQGAWPQAERSTDLFRRRRKRLAGFVLAIAVQAGFLALLVISRPVIAPPEKLTKELTLFLPRLPRAAPPPLALPAPAQQAAPRLTAPLAIIPAPLPNPLRAAPMAPDLSQLGQFLFGCTPEQWSSLTPEQRAECPRPGEGIAVQQAPNLLGSPSHVQDNARWANALAHEQSPVLLPGASPKSFGFTIMAVDSSGKVSGFLGSVLDGTLADPETWPTEDVTTYAPEDFYKREQDYAAWNKAHGGVPPSATPAGKQ